MMEFLLSSPSFDIPQNSLGITFNKVTRQNKDTSEGDVASLVKSCSEDPGKSSSFSEVKARHMVDTDTCVGSWEDLPSHL